MDDTLCQYRKAWNKENLNGTNFPQSLKYFFENLEPINNAIDAVDKLKEKYDVWILTAPSVYNPMSYTEKRIWVEKHLGFDMCHKLIICPNKGLIIGKEEFYDSRFSYFDHNVHQKITHILIDSIIEGKGQENFKGKLIQFGSNDYPDWKTILQYLL